MSEYDDATNGDRIAARYDDWYGDLPYGGPIERTVTSSRISPATAPPSSWA